MMKLTTLLTFSLCCLVTATFAQSTKHKVKAATTVKQKSKADTTDKHKQPQIFKGLNQYRTWTVGANMGLLSGSVLTGGSNDFHVVDVKAGFGVSVRKQFGHVFGLQFDGLTGHIAGSVPRDRTQWIQSFDTELGYASTLSLVANLGGMNFMKRAHKVNFFALGGMGFMGFAPSVTYKNGTKYDTKGYNGVFKDKVYIHEFDTFAGLGMRYKLSDRININAGYTEHFIDNDFLDGIHNVQVNGRDYEKDKYSYGYMGLEYSLGHKYKPNVEWVNPAALLYDAQMENTIHEEYQILKERTDNVIRNMAELKADTDGDGIHDWLDKCPGTAKGVKVDNSGCPIVAAAAPIHVVDTLVKETIVKQQDLLNRLVDVIAKQNIQFNINSAEIPARYYKNLDDMAVALKANPAKSITLTGYASLEGKVKYNTNLSQQRAEAVKAYLVKAGADAKQISVKVSGTEKPVANNQHEEGRVINRRVEIE